MDDISDLVLEEEGEIINEDWEEVRDDSSLFVMDDTLQSSFSTLETSVENTLAESVTSEQNSGIFEALASMAAIQTAE